MKHRKKKSSRKTNNYSGERDEGRCPKSFPPPPPPQTGTASGQIFDKGFSLRDVSTNRRKPAFWKSNTSLRHTKISFVTGGKLDSTKPKDTETALPNLELDTPVESSSAQVDKDQDAAIEICHTESGRPLPEASSSAGYFIDLQGDVSVQTGLSPPRVRCTSPTPSSSSEEVILFKGRIYQEKPLHTAPDKNSISATTKTDADNRFTENIIQEQRPLTEQTSHGCSQSSIISFKPKNESWRQPNVALRGPKQTSRGRRNISSEVENALIDDYLANIEPEDSFALDSFSKRELDDFIDDLPGIRASPGSAGRRKPRYDSPIIRDVDDMGSCNIIKGEVQEILAQRSRNSVVQYLVIWQDLSICEAEWVPVTSLTSDAALSVIQMFEAKDKLAAQVSDEESVESTDSDDMIISDAEHQEEVPDEDFFLHGNYRMNDEDIARILSKQEEIGMGSDKLLLFDETVNYYGSALCHKTKKIPRMARKNKTKKHGPARSREYPSSVSHLYDFNDGFDLMDFERPSLIKSKGRKGKFVSHSADPELQEDLKIAWQNDRLKKKVKKQEREELRAQGLLGSKNCKPSLRLKYKDEMGILAIKKEVKAFLRRQDTTLTFPSMDKADRKFMHEVAHAFNLISKSLGVGSSRFTVFYRTSRTTAFAEEKFDAIKSRMLNRTSACNNPSGRNNPSKGVRKRGGKHGSNSAAMAYQDGDVVGCSAPELASDNKGRAILEKMGWSSGTALGALNNKGILQPVIHVIKTTKAGLG